MMRKLLIFLSLLIAIPSHAQMAKDLSVVFTDLKDRSKTLALLKTNKNFIRIKSNAVFQNLASTKLDIESAEVAVAIFYIDSMRRIVLNEQPQVITQNMRLLEKVLAQQNLTAASADDEQWRLLNQLFDLPQKSRYYQTAEKFYSYVKDTKMVSPFEAILAWSCLTYRAYGAAEKALNCMSDMVKRGNYLPGSYYANLLTNLRVVQYFEKIDTVGFENYIKTLSSTTEANRLLNKPFQASNLLFMKGKYAEAIKELDSILTTNTDPSPNAASLRYGSQANKARILIRSGNLPEALKIITALGASEDKKMVDHEYRYLLLAGYYYLKTKDYEKILELFSSYIASNLKLENAFEEIHLYGIYCGAGFLINKVPARCKEILQKHDGVEKIADITPSVLLSMEVIKKSVVPTQQISENLIKKLEKRTDLEVYQILGTAVKDVFKVIKTK